MTVARWVTLVLAIGFLGAWAVVSGLRLFYHRPPEFEPGWTSYPMLASIEQLAKLRKTLLFADIILRTLAALSLAVHLVLLNLSLRRS